jgi:uncharacterized protein YndB with AHSA1/START domain
MPADHAPGADLVLTRALDAPRALVFKVWTDPEQLKQWWGPHGFTTPTAETDARPGGALRIVMEGYGMTHEMTGQYLEVVEPERLSFATQVLDEHGVSYLEILNTISLTEDGDKTILTLTARVTKAGPGSERPLEGMHEGWEQTLERLAAYVKKLS